MLRNVVCSDPIQIILNAHTTLIQTECITKPLSEFRNVELSNVCSLEGCVVRITRATDPSNCLEVEIHFHRCVLHSIPFPFASDGLYDTTNIRIQCLNLLFIMLKNDTIFPNKRFASLILKE